MHGIISVEPFKGEVERGQLFYGRFPGFDTTVPTFQNRLHFVGKVETYHENVNLVLYTRLNINGLTETTAGGSTLREDMLTIVIRADSIAYPVATKHWPRIMRTLAFGKQVKFSLPNVVNQIEILE